MELLLDPSDMRKIRVIIRKETYNKGLIIVMPGDVILTLALEPIIRQNMHTLHQLPNLPVTIGLVTTINLARTSATNREFLLNWIMHHNGTVATIVGSLIIESLIVGLITGSSVNPAMSMAIRHGFVLQIYSN